jgi:hypothetical protein
LPVLQKGSELQRLTEFVYCLFRGFFELIWHLVLIKQPGVCPSRFVRPGRQDSFLQRTDATLVLLNL